MQTLVSCLSHTETTSFVPFSALHRIFDINLHCKQTCLFNDDQCIALDKNYKARLLGSTTWYPSCYTVTALVPTQRLL